MIPPGRYRIRQVEWKGEIGYPQGVGMTWEDIEIEIHEGEVVLCAEYGSGPGPGFDGRSPFINVLIGTPIKEES